MSAERTLTLRRPLTSRVDAAELPWSSVATAEGAALAALPLWVEGQGAIALGELFEVSGGPGGATRLVGDLSRVDGIGAGLTGGLLVVEGNAGRYLGRGMSGGAIDVRGNVAARAGGAEPGAKRGMRGGEIIVRGSAGPQAGAGMRRGVIVVQGPAAEDAGRGMIAGSVIVLGSLGPNPGIFSRRGSIVAFGSCEPPASFRFACTYQPPHLRVSLRYLHAKHGVPVTAEQMDGTFRRYSGDLAELGAGEILAWTR